MRLEKLDLNRVHALEYKHEKPLDEEFQKALKDSIEQLGLLNPLLAVRIGGDVWLVDGYHRLKALCDLGVEEVPAIILDGRSTADVYLAALTSNAMRRRVKPSEMAWLIGRLVEECGLSIRSIARRLGVSHTSVERAYALSTRPPEEQERFDASILRRHVQPGNLVATMEAEETGAKTAVSIGFPGTQRKSESEAGEQPSRRRGGGGGVRCPVCGKYPQRRLTGGATGYWIYFCPEHEKQWKETMEYALSLRGGSSG